MSVNDIGAGMQIAAQVAPKLSKLKAAANNVEAVFLKDLITEMRKSVNKVSLGKSYGGDIYQDMLDQQFAESASKSGSFGIGKILYQQFSKDVMRQAATQINVKQKMAEAMAAEESGSSASSGRAAGGMKVPPTKNGGIRP